MSHWAIQIDLKDVFHNDDLTFLEKREAILHRLRNSWWYRTSEEVRDLIDNDLATVEDTNEFNEAWDLLYDLADMDRVWIATS